MEGQKQVETVLPLRLQQIKQEAKDTYTFIFPKPKNFSWKEGACVHLGNSKFDIKKGKANKEHVRHLSIASLPDEGVLTISTRIPEIRSAFKDTLSRAVAGDTFTLFKPENRMELKRGGRPVILITAGVGMAPARSQMRAYMLSRSGIPSVQHINIDSSGEYLYQQEIDQYVQKTEGLTNFFVSSRGDFYQRLATAIQDNGLYYIIGSDTFLVAVGRWLLARGISDSSIILDKQQSFYEEMAETIQVH